MICITIYQGLHINWIETIAGAWGGVQVGWRNNEQTKDRDAWSVS